MKHRGTIGGVVLLSAVSIIGLTACGSENNAEATIPGPEIASSENSSTTAPAPPQSTITAPSSPTPEPTPEPTRASDPSWDPDSIHVLANRQNPLDPVDYTPDDLVYPDVPQYGPEAAMMLREEAGEALEELIAAGDSEGMHLGFVSGFRSFDYQVQIYGARHAEVGTEQTDLYMSRPGYSEHQTGLAADVISIANEDCMLGECFADTPEGQWVAEHAHEHGFVIRYLKDMEHITGYPYEPWHLRYVGEETAEEVFEQGLTLEEYWEQDPAPDYEEPEPNPEHLPY